MNTRRGASSTPDPQDRSRADAEPAGAAQRVGEPAGEHRCGYVAIVGRPNVGKSTLLNRLVGQDIAITSSKPQTTRHRTVGVRTQPGAQLLFLDSPGFQTRQTAPLNRVLNRTARQVAEGADVVVQVCDAQRWTAADAAVASLIPAGVPVILALNKVDRVRERSVAFACVEAAGRARAFDEFVPVSARSGDQVDLLARLCADRLPLAAPVYGEDEITDRSERFLAAEVVREKLFRLLGDELPYASTVVVESFETLGALRRIHAAILVAREGQRPIVLGAGGERIKRISTDARRSLEALFGGKIYLELFVKVRSGWADSEQSLRAFGYE